jgi:3-oxoacyl-[acyl-carrier-protein] synthase II
MSSDAVITGLGVVSPIGMGLDAFWASCVEGRSGTGPLTQAPAEKLPVKVAGEIDDFDPTTVLSRKEVRRTSRFVQLAYAAVNESLEHAGLDISDLDPTRVGVVLGNAGGSIVTLVNELSVYNEKGYSYCDPLVFGKTFPYMAATIIALKLGIRGYTSTCVTACSASTEAIGIAANLVKSGTIDVAIAGGTEAWLSDLPLMTLGLLRVFTTADVPPETASRPFDRTRDGFVPAEGAGAIVIESSAHAKRRGAEPLAAILGFGATNDAYHFTAPHPDGRDSARAMELALADAGCRAEDVSYVSAHATSTKVGDSAESRAIMHALGKRAFDTPVSALKSMTGHCIAASGAIEVVASVMAIQTGVVPPTINLANPDPECPLDYVPNTSRRASVDIVLKNSFAMGGQNVCLVLSQPR